MKALTMIRHLVFLALAGALLFLPACDDGSGGGGGKGSPMFVAVGEDGLISSTTDGSNWNDHSISTPNDFWSVIYGDKFVAVGGEGMIYTSSDGEEWEEQTSGTTSHIYSVAYGKGLYIAVGYDGLVLTSPDAVTWTNRSTVSTDDDMTSLVFGNNEFVAVGANGLVMTTNGVIVEDELSWNILSQTSYASKIINYISFGKNRYVDLIVADKHIITSSATITTSSFTLSHNNNSGASLFGVDFCNNEFISVGWKGEIWRSSDGINWSNYSLEGFGPNISFWATAYGNKRYIIVGDDVYYGVSANGVDWHIDCITDSNKNFYDITFANL